MMNVSADQNSHKQAPLWQQARPGYSIVEVTLAAVMIGLLAVGVAQSLSSSATATFMQRHRTIASQIAADWTEFVAVGGPQASSPIDTFPVDGTGTPTNGGFYRVAIDSTIQCNGGTDPGDNTAETSSITTNCSSQKPTLSYIVDVSFPARGDNPDRIHIIREITIGELGRSTSSLGM